MAHGFDEITLNKIQSSGQVRALRGMDFPGELNVMLGCVGPLKRDVLMMSACLVSRTWWLPITIPVLSCQRYFNTRTCEGGLYWAPILVQKFWL